MLLALSASPEELELVLISVTYGNVDHQAYVVPEPRVVSYLTSVLAAFAMS
jgi:hypothetical protein